LDIKCNTLNDKPNEMVFCTGAVHGAAPPGRFRAPRTERGAARQIAAGRLPVPGLREAWPEGGLGVSGRREGPASFKDLRSAPAPFQAARRHNPSMPSKPPVPSKSSPMRARGLAAPGAHAASVSSVIKVARLCFQPRRRDGGKASACKPLPYAPPARAAGLRLPVRVFRICLWI
jgi:hypothetical protein